MKTPYGMCPKTPAWKRDAAGSNCKTPEEFFSKLSLESGKTIEGNDMGTFSTKGNDNALVQCVSLCSKDIFY
jgi:hypothetical protein